MFGEVGAWFYKGLGGIRPDRENPGFKNILLEPHFVPGLNTFTAEHQSRHGKLVCSWKRTNRGIQYTVNIPPNTTATLRLGVSEKATVKESGVAIERKAGLDVLEDKGTLRVYQLESGFYTFDIH
jgi:alpha-L-rhamnosidase